MFFVDENGIRRCGGVTVSGDRCRRDVGQRVACATHWNEDAQVMADALDAEWTMAYQLGKQTGRHEVLAEQRAVEAEATERRNWRLRDERDRQLVQVAGYTYTWSGPDLAVGDVVELPGSEIRPHVWRGGVAKLGSSYRGPTKSVLRLAPAEVAS